MISKKYPVVLSVGAVTELKHFVSTGTHKSQEIIRARILLLAHEGQTDAAIIRSVGCSPSTALIIRKRLHERGSWQAAVVDAPRTGQPPKLTEAHKAFVTATACSDPPPGHAHWTIEALREELLKTYTELRSIGSESIRKILVASQLKPWREKNVVHSQTQRPVQRTAGGHS